MTGVAILGLTLNAELVAKTGLADAGRIGTVAAQIAKAALKELGSSAEA